MKYRRTIAIALLAMLYAAMPIRACAMLPQKGLTALYHRYAERTELTVAQVKGFRLNDSVRMDVVILVADDSTAWEGLCKEFDIRNQRGLATWTGVIDHPERRIRYNGGPCCRVIASPARRTICLCLLKDENDYDSLLDYQMNLMAR